MWDGPYIDENNVNTVPDTGPVTVWLANNVTLRNLELRGKHATWSDRTITVSAIESRIASPSPTASSTTSR